MGGDGRTRTVMDLVGAKLRRTDGSYFDPWDSLTLSSLLDRGRWNDDTPIGPWERAALKLLLDDRVPVDWEVPEPSA